MTKLCTSANNILHVGYRNLQYVKYLLPNFCLVYIFQPCWCQSQGGEEIQTVLRTTNTRYASGSYTRGYTGCY